ncbi:alpha-hydroxy acid oxidase [Breoghania sp. L-A4]|uniref:alpha-hydroxy acid oxidase n=1 Tax=Breoghania sp. L-A4 TaxID=2304600 RepID=UPI000E35D0FE|nr:alpha-hydroxy acid oxidase [Breoghania sp. L-A4]AXS40384.1 alpha-hydroxy-acid oxidizing protein [Breoghania sp. L-A4]
MTLDRVQTIADLRARARRRVPRLAFDFLDGGAGEEVGVRENTAGFARLKLSPRVLRDVSDRTLSVDLFGRRRSAPIGVSPIGMANALWPRTDEILAQMAQQARIPYVLSTAGTTSIERIAEVAPDSAWFQLYVSQDDSIALDMMRRAHEAGVSVLVLTVDVPLPGRRYRDMRNGFALPLRPSPSTILDLAARPRWILETLRHGTPSFANYVPYARGETGGQALAAFMAGQVSPNLGVERVRMLRDAWQGTFVVKGVLRPEDAVTAAELGADGIIVSNHGGRQLEAAPAAIDALPGVVEAVGDRVTVMMDSGIRQGADIVKAYCLGARFVFSGRSFVYGACAAGAEGARRALDILTGECDQTLGQIGCDDINGLDTGYLWRED